MVNWVEKFTSLGRSKHAWSEFHNPRNKQVKITACTRCGIAKGRISNNVECEALTDESHRMRKMGWLNQEASP